MWIVRNKANKRKKVIQLTIGIVTSNFCNRHQAFMLPMYLRAKDSFQCLLKVDIHVNFNQKEKFDKVKMLQVYR